MLYVCVCMYVLMYACVAVCVRTYGSGSGARKSAGGVGGAAPPRRYMRVCVCGEGRGGMCVYVCVVFGVSTDSGGSGARRSWRPRGLWWAQRPRALCMCGVEVYVYMWGQRPSLARTKRALLDLTSLPSSAPSLLPFLPPLHDS